MRMVTDAMEAEKELSGWNAHGVYSEFKNALEDIGWQLEAEEGDIKVIRGCARFDFLKMEQGIFDHLLRMDLRKERLKRSPSLKKREEEMGEVTSADYNATAKTLQAKRRKGIPSAKGETYAASYAAGSSSICQL